MDPERVEGEGRGVQVFLHEWTGFPHGSEETEKFGGFRMRLVFHEEVEKAGQGLPYDGEQLSSSRSLFTRTIEWTLLYICYVCTFTSNPLHISFVFKMRTV